MKLETCRDWIDLVNDPELDMLDLLSDFSKLYATGKTYKKLGNIGNDWNWSVPDIEPSSAFWRGGTGKRTESFNFTSAFDKYPSDSKICEKALSFLKMTKYHSVINNQKPTQITRLHYDTLDSFFDNFEDLLDHPFDLVKLQPKGFKNVRRFFVALEDWSPGQMFQMDSDHWVDWKKGDVIEFFWQYNLHSTANASFVDRPLLKITGYSDLGE